MHACMIHLSELTVRSRFRKVRRRPPPMSLSEMDALEESVFESVADGGRSFSSLLDTHYL